jgi:hypothetical protein
MKLNSSKNAPFGALYQSLRDLPNPRGFILGDLLFHFSLKTGIWQSDK